MPFCIRIAPAFLAAVLMTGCFIPNVQRCAVQCNSAGDCPPDTTCAEDGFCHESRQEPGCLDPDGGNPVDGDGSPLIDADPDTPDAIRIDAGPPRSPVAAGEIIITEIMKDPCVAVAANCTVLDADGEWFELHNTTGDAIDLDGVDIDGINFEVFTIFDVVIISPGAHLVFGASSDTLRNGGLEVDFDYDGDAFILGNNGTDRIDVSFGALLLDRVEWNDADFPDTAGAALSLDPDSYDHVSNDTGGNWCNAGPTFGQGDHGTPGLINPNCP